jgi:hypothetical protein
VLEMDFDDDVDATLISQLNQSDDVKVALANVIKGIRKNYEEGEVTQNFGHRTLHNVLLLSKQFDLNVALDLAYTNKLPDGEKASVKTIIGDLASVLKTAQKATKNALTAGGGKATTPHTGQIIKGIDVDRLAQIMADKGDKK